MCAGVSRYMCNTIFYFTGVCAGVGRYKCNTILTLQVCVLESVDTSVTLFLLYRCVCAGVSIYMCNTIFYFTGVCAGVGRYKCNTIFYFTGVCAGVGRYKCNAIFTLQVCVHESVDTCVTLVLLNRCVCWSQ